jgi:hypothetical protein
VCEKQQLTLFFEGSYISCILFAHQRFVYVIIPVNYKIQNQRRCVSTAVVIWIVLFSLFAIAVL